jgi:hypothetical protein
MNLDPDSAIFVTGLQDANKNQFKKKVLWLLLFEGTFFNDIKSKRSHKAVGLVGFLTLFAW